MIHVPTYIVMNNKPKRRSSLSDCKNNVSVENSEGSALSKLRRLKMQEKILTNKINVNLNKFDIQTLDFNRKLLFVNINKSFIEIKNIFEDVKHNSLARNISSIDVDQIKKDVLMLEERIRDLKKFLHSEITELTNVEQTIAKEVDELKEDQPKPKTATLRKLKSFNDIVPSPVRAIINTPYKYKEVQNLHEFLSESGGKYGGWHEFNHTLFLQSRQKYVFSKENTANYEIELKSFVDELLIKIPGTSAEKIMEHEMWYIKLMELQKQQHDAINRWKQSKKCVKSSYHLSQRPTKQSNTIDIKDRKSNCKENCTLKKCSKSTDNGNVKSSIHYYTGYTKTSDLSSCKSDATKEYSENGCDADILDSQGSRASNINSSRSKYSYMDPTRVWINRNIQKETETTTNTHYITLDTIKKLGIPVWRQGLQ